MPKQFLLCWPEPLFQVISNAFSPSLHERVVLSLWHNYHRHFQCSLWAQEQSQHLTLGLVKSIHNSLGYLVCRGMILNGYSGPKDSEILDRLSVSARICCSAPLAREARDLPMPILPCQPPAVLCFLWPLRANGHWLDGPPWLWQQRTLCLCLYKLVDLKKPHEV